MQHAYRIERFEVPARPWRIAAVALASIAALELTVLVISGGVILARGEEPQISVNEATRAATAAQPAPKQAAAPQATPRPAVAMLPRRHIALIILNGNGRPGAATAAAARAGSRGYRVQGIANAPAVRYPRSLVMYRRGFAEEAQRLARDLGVRVVGPLDGLRPAQLHGAHAVLILGG